MSAARPMPCPQCGYDLRGHAREGTFRCPECGTETSIEVMREWERRRTEWRPVDTALVLCGIVPGVVTTLTLLAGTLGGNRWGITASLVWVMCILLSIGFAWIGSDRHSPVRRVIHTLLAPIVVTILNLAIVLVLSAVGLSILALRADP